MDYNRAYNRVQQLKKFYKNLMWFGIISLVIIGDDWFNDELRYQIFGGHLLLSIWALVLVVKAISLFIFNDEWEQGIIEKEVGKNKKTVNF
ncbi:2TM domain-containing protein [Chryseobacterium indologenes]|uniref:2TM domain-containing protein n=1 Tax=Chryseobacterium TaxID=59732 RepID=UPI0016242C22|nr:MULTISPECIES: 2TM domain-containing protein [Chryseobacterium]MDM1553961.1 2TM domain-containing protein [Chryseobacterium indologenes]WET48050.1 2TM domain-containing protein [Chryseobacterium indologenes]